MSTPPSPSTTQPTSIHGTERTTTQYSPGPTAEGETRRKVQSHQPTSHGPAYITWSSRPPDNILNHEQSNHDQPPRSSLSVRQQASNQPTNSSHQSRLIDSAPLQQQPRPSLPTTQTQHQLSSPVGQHQLRPQCQLRSTTHQSQLWPSSSAEQPKPSSSADHLQPQPSSSADQRQPQPSSSAYQPQHQPSSSADQPQPQSSSSARSRSGRQVKVPAKFQDYKL